MKKTTLIFIIYVGLCISFYQVVRLGSLAIEAWLTIESQKLSIERHRLINELCDGDGFFKGETLTCGEPEQIGAQLL